MKRLLLIAAAATGLHAQTPPTLMPYGAWAICDAFNPIPVWALTTCNTLSPTAPKPWMLSVWATRDDTVAFSYQIQYEDAAGNEQLAIGAFLRSDLQNSKETIYYPVNGLNGAGKIGSITVEELTTFEKGDSRR
jgi:hypothetical protein